MKLTTSILILLFAALFFSGCASADSKSTDPESAVEEQPETAANTEEQPETTTDDRRSGSLLDRYISGDIPGYQD